MNVTFGRIAPILVAVLFLLGHAARADETDKVIRETWETALLGGQKAGHVHFTIREVSDGKTTRLIATRELLLKLKRGPDVAVISATITSEETPEGQVERITMTQALGRQQQLKLVADVKDDKVSVTATVSGEERPARLNPFPKGTIGLVKESRFLADQQVKNGDELEYRYFEPQVGAVVTVKVSVGEESEVKLPTGEVRNLRKVIQKPEPIGGVQLPASTVWTDPETNVIVLTQGEMPGLGELSLYQTSKEVALAPFVPQVDAFNQSVVLRQRVLNVHQMSRIVYKVTLTNDEGEGSPLPTDVKQRVKPVPGEDGTLEVTVDKVLAPATTAEDAKPAGDEFIKPNMFIKSDDDLVREYAARAVGDEKDDWTKARMIEKWVHQNMKAVDFSEALATADHVAKTLRGDCTEYSMLAAAMCRAAGVPSRTAIGLVYVDSPTKPLMAFHMWTEVYVRGKWLTLDATLGQGGVGPGHLKITDHSWHDTRSFTPLLPVMRFLIGKPSIEITAVYE